MLGTVASESKAADDEIHEEFLHPNLIKERDTIEALVSKSEFIKREKKKKGSCGEYFKRFDTLIMRPIFIFNYHKELIRKKDEFVELFMKEGEMWEKIYAHNEETQALQRDPTSHGRSLMEHLRKQSVKHPPSIIKTSPLLSRNTSIVGNFKKSVTFNASVQEESKLE